MKRTAATTGGFFLFLLLGGAWVGFGRVLPDGIPQATITVGLAVVFVSMFVWNLISRVQEILADTDRMLRESLLALVNLALLLLAFAIVYQRLGIIDNTAPGGAVTHDFWLCAYYSVVTFTTLGYGDFYPTGVGRILAALESFTGYLILGILASSAATLLSPHEAPGADRADTEAEA